ISPRISFGAWEDLMITHHSFTIRAEQIGNLRYLSGYILLFGADQKPLACLNIPYLSQQEILDTRIRDFLSVLGYIYLVVLLILGGLSLVFSRYMTRPLTLLRQRLDATILGGENKPLEVKTQDEIGTIAKSYNQMLVKLRASEAQLGQTQREMAWREMARQVAHEIKNPLTPMKLSLQHLLRAWKDQHPQREEILNSVTTSVLLQIDSLATIATAFSTFATLPQPQIKLFDVKELLQQTADLYQQAPEGAVILELPEHPIIMKADPEQIGRVLQNLVKNGLQSLNEHGIVKLSLSEIPSGILIIVEDNGSGIPDEIRPHIFEPNFSTKTSGMGLGLALVRRIVEGSGGTIRFESEIENGTRFYLEFPKAD
ncbi:MAG: HAMP domain-containing protein, partial [Sphingobacteriia bacterium]|nr:HAMP domain-containing protein [Sphingobacteriia bacterium]